MPIYDPMELNELTAWLHDHAIYAGHPNERSRLAAKLKRANMSRATLEDLERYVRSALSSPSMVPGRLRRCLESDLKDLFSSVGAWRRRQDTPPKGSVVPHPNAYYLPSDRRSRCCDALIARKVGGNRCDACGKAVAS